MPDWTNPVPSSGRITPERCGTLATWMNEAIATFAGWRLPILSMQRLVDGRDWLRMVAEDGCYPDDDVALIRSALAIRDAVEFSQIARALGRERMEMLVGDLKEALGGVVDQDNYVRTPYQYQSQLWIGALLAAGGHGPRVPHTSGKSPDFVLENGMSLYGLEVKRPSSRAGVRSVFEKAVEQLNEHEVKGAVIVDASDCFLGGAPSEVVDDDSLPPNTEASALLDEIGDELSDVIFDTERMEHRAGYGRVLHLLVYAKGIRWSRTDLSGPFIFQPAYRKTFTRARGNLDWHRGLWLHRLLQPGMRDVGYQTTPLASEEL